MPDPCSPERAAFPAARPDRARAAFPATRYRTAANGREGAKAAHRPRGAPPDALPRRQAAPAGGGPPPPAGSPPHSAPRSPLRPTTPGVRTSRPLRPTATTPPHPRHHPTGTHPYRPGPPPGLDARDHSGKQRRTVREAVTMSSTDAAAPNPARPPVHVPVPLERVTELLPPACSADGAVLVDATLGLAGHALA